MRDRVTLLYEGRTPTTDWSCGAASANVVRVPGFAMVEPALDTAIRELGIEVTSVVFDRSITAAEFLSFLCAIPHDFLGDALSINSDGTAFLSAATTADGRVLYQLESADVEFYLRARFRSRGAIVRGAAEVAN